MIGNEMVLYFRMAQVPLEILDEEKRVNWIVEWIDRMVDRYGGIVYEKDTTKTWDWGQALCRECFGVNWSEVIRREGINTPSWENIDRAKRWENGKLPDWFVDTE